jgi:hypothetical protein
MKQSLFALIFIGASFQSALANSGTETFLKSCFKEYVVAFSSSDGTSEAKANAVRKRCLSADFNKKWKSLVRQTDADALILAQDTLDSWSATQTIKNFDEKAQSADILLGKGEEAHCLSVTFKDEKATPRISSVRDCSNK